VLKKLENMKAIETKYHQDGYAFVCGIDEVGRGPLAGPVVCAAVIMPEDSKILYVDDSKKLSAKMRETLNEQILQEALAVEFGVRTPEEIDRMNILGATKDAMEGAVSALSIKPDILLIDAVTIHTPIETRAIIHGDAVCYCIAAASIVAKVHRDEMMKAYHALYPEYGFDRNMGYGTVEHIEAIKKYGLTPIHRLSFVKNFR
ncbi:MAG: ribonuclease HII, partial [Eubacterium sp.]